QNKIAAMLKPGMIPAEIYRDVMESLDESFKQNFMGFKERRVKFLGHGIGLHVDEEPVIAEGFNEPLLEGMLLALEPKKGIEKVGMVGIENTFKVTGQGGVCITGDNPGLIPVF
ncbi:MAG TPA: M24 family metallopeptidase, partial [Acetivibrio sp.]|nr:M24 family metallopeptidase [Acetivibrio sp.]